MILHDTWTLRRLIGVGSDSAVYEARHADGSEAAIKWFDIDPTHPELSVQRIRDERHVAELIDHPAIVRILGEHVDVPQGYAYLVLELLEGETLRQRLEREGPLPPTAAVDALLEVCHCASLAHHLGIIHGDIKPDHLFQTRSGIKLLDFGASQLQGAPETFPGAVGTPAYTAPEQAMGVNAWTPSVDVFAAGATLHHLVTGSTLHPMTYGAEMLVRAAWTPAPKVRSRFPHVPKHLADVIDDACAHDPELRIQNADELMHRLRVVRRELLPEPRRGWFGNAVSPVILALVLTALLLSALVLAKL